MCLASKDELERNKWQARAVGIEPHPRYLVLDTSVSGPVRLQDASAIDSVRFILAVRGVSSKMLRDIADGIDSGREVPEDP